MTKKWNIVADNLILPTDSTEGYDSLDEAMEKEKDFEWAISLDFELVGLKPICDGTISFKTKEEAIEYRKQKIENFLDTIVLPYNKYVELYTKLNGQAPDDRKDFQQRAVDVLNEFVKLDELSANVLFRHHCPTNENIADHPTITTLSARALFGDRPEIKWETGDSPYIGFMGLLNGIIRNGPSDPNYIISHWNDNDRLTHFTFGPLTK